MARRPIVPSVLGHDVERLITRDVAALSELLHRLPAQAWQRPTPVGGAAVAVVVAHLTDSAVDLATAWQRRDPALIEPFEDPPPQVGVDADDVTGLRAAYRRATQRLMGVLGTSMDADWSFPVSSPLGGVETLAEAARRWYAHHFVHRQDILAALGRPPDRDDTAVRMVVEFVLDAVARRGGELLPPPLEVEVVTAPPGAGTWTLVFEEPAPRRDVESVWRELLDAHPEAAQRHRLERGSSDEARLEVLGRGEEVWRAGFRRGGDWARLEVHGDDEARAAWAALVDRIRHTGLGRVTVDR